MGISEQILIKQLSTVENVDKLRITFPQMLRHIFGHQIALTKISRKF